ncbi:acylhydrolase [Trinickia terrae]|uniref:Acylhydrolase n=1 Tax=Trinickia terrae TaxID=2571161 RepID=A0A4U1I8H4_9BURK|nr:SGNH/GDSL hydrolase family protein [Trinickia terrae]TKC89763.1 acylhydrolase [Trinickia terrae]
MKHTNKTQPKRLLRVAQSAIACAAFALLAACGGGGGSNSSTTSNSSTPAGGVSLQVVSFGDSLSDVGTYSEVILPDFGGGKFTTNPGQIWVQDVANYYGGTITPAYLGGFGLALTSNGGLGYGQGGSRVSAEEGEGWAANNAAATTVPVVDQVTNYLNAHGSFNSGQLVLINGGANDILENATAIGTAVTTGLTNGTYTSQTVAVTTETEKALATTATALVTQVGRILAAGATHVVLVNVPDIGTTPLGLSEGTSGAALLTGITGVYNAMLVAGLQSAGLSSSVIYADAFTWLDGTVLPNYSSLGFQVSNTGTACNLTQMEANATAYATANPSVLSSGETAAQFGAAFGSSLFCSPQTLTVSGADQTYMFADSIHPTTKLHSLFASFVEGKIAAAGLGK